MQFRFWTVAFCMLLLAGCAGVEVKRPDPPTPQQIVSLAREGVAAKDIIKRLDEAHAVYRLPASELARLREQGVPDEVIDYMNNSHLEAVRRDEALRQYQRELFYGWPPLYPYYRYPFGPWSSWPWWR